MAKEVVAGSPPLGRWGRKKTATASSAFFAGCRKIVDGVKKRRETVWERWGETSLSMQIARYRTEEAEKRANRGEEEGSENLLQNGRGKRAPFQGRRKRVERRKNFPFERRSSFFSRS